jgi:recombination protein RecT
MTEPQSLVPSGESQQIKTLRDLLYKYKDRIGAVIPAKILTVDRLLQLASAACARDQKLLACAPISILRSVMVAAQLGLDPTGVLGQGYLVPFFNKKTGRTEAQFIPGYKGLADLMRRSERVGGIEARVVYDGEPFEYEEGITKVLRHKPSLHGMPDAKNAVGAYAIIRLKEDPVPHTEWMTREQIEAIRHRSRAGESGPWVTDWGQMARKTVLRRAANYAPLSTDAQRAIAVEDRFESGDTDVGDIVDLPVLDDTAADAGAPAPASKSSRLAADLKAKAGTPSPPEEPGPAAPVPASPEPPQQPPAAAAEQAPLEIGAEEAAAIHRREVTEAEHQGHRKEPR